MFYGLVYKIKKNISGDSRSSKANKNAFFSFFLKGINILIGIVYVPITLKYLDKEKYGLWLAVSSILMWISYFNLGLGNGLKNYLTEAIAKKKSSLAKEYVSTTYFILTIIFILIYLIFLFFNQYIDWTKILNCKEQYYYELKNLTNIIVLFFCVRFILQIIVDIYSSFQKVAFGNFLSTLGQFLALFFIIILTQMTKEGNLIEFGSIFSIAPVLVFLVGSFVAFKLNLKEVRPSIYNINFKHVKKLLGIGVKFLIIQLSILVIIQTPNFLVSHFFGPKEVPVFFVSQKYYSVIYMGYVIFIQAYWPAYTEAYAKNDILWIKKTLSKLNRYFLFLLFAGLVMFILSPIVFKYLTLDKIEIPFSISLFSLLYYLMICYGGIYTTFLAAINKLNIQMFAYLIGACLFIPLVYLFCVVLNFGIIGIIIAMILSSFYYLIAPFEVKKLLNKIN